MLAVAEIWRVSDTCTCMREVSFCDGVGFHFFSQYESLSLFATPPFCQNLNNEEGLFPGANNPGQKNQKHPIRLGTGRSFHLSPENNKLLTQECIFSHEFGLATGLVCQCPQHERSGVRFGPGDKAMVERPKTKV